MISGIFLLLTYLMWTLSECIAHLEETAEACFYSEGCPTPLCTQVFPPAIYTPDGNVRSLSPSVGARTFSSVASLPHGSHNVCCCSLFFKADTFLAMQDIIQSYAQYCLIL